MRSLSAYCPIPGVCVCVYVRECVRVCMRACVRVCARPRVLRACMQRERASMSCLRAVLSPCVHFLLEIHAQVFVYFAWARGGWNRVCMRVEGRGAGTWPVRIARE